MNPAFPVESRLISFAESFSLIKFIPMSELNQDQDAKVHSVETAREGKSRGGKMQPSVRSPHRQKRGSALTPLGTSWLQVRADWESGAFSERALADAHGIHVATMRARMQREGWPARPMRHLVSQALPGLVDAIPGETDPDLATIESITAQIEGRPADSETMLKERAKASAQRKALVLRNHRYLADAYQKLASSGLTLLIDYANGSLPRAFVKAKNEKGEEVTVPFHLLSKQHGLMDGIDKAGTILAKAIQLQRMVHGLEAVDGDGNPLPKAGSVSASPFTQLTDGELRSEFQKLVESLQSASRVTPIPPALAAARVDA